MKQRLVRPGDTLDDEAIVVRGGELVVDVLRRDAQRMWDIYGVFGISVFAVQGTTIDELAQGSPLVRFATLTTLVVRAIRFTGMAIEATGRNRLHYTVLLPDLDVAVGRLCACEHQVIDNPYHEE